MEKVSKIEIPNVIYHRQNPREMYVFYAICFVNPVVVQTVKRMEVTAPDLSRYLYISKLLRVFAPFLQNPLEFHSYINQDGFCGYFYLLELSYVLRQATHLRQKLVEL